MIYLLFKQNNEGMSKQLFDFDDILIQPADKTEINSRSQINARYRDYLPLMTAPMDTVVSQDNKRLFDELGIRVVLPRISNPNDNYVSSTEFLSYSLTDFERIFLDRTPERKYKKMFALIDVANGHMENVYEFAKSAKIKYDDDLILMVGNVANPDTYYKFASINVDYVRIGIGNGAGCLTTQQTGIGYPMASLIEECGNIQTKKSFTDYQLHIEWRIPADIEGEGQARGNSGLFLVSTGPGDAGYELQILDNEADMYKSLNPYQYHGSVYGIIPAKLGFLKPLGEWNEQEVIAQGNKIKVILNGEVIVDGDIALATKEGTADHREHPGLFNKTGHIGFLGHGSPLKFRNLRIKELIKKK